MDQEDRPSKGEPDADEAEAGGAQALVRGAPKTVVAAPMPSRAPGMHAAPRPMGPRLAGEAGPLESASLFGLADALLKAPANVRFELDRSGRALGRFLGLLVLCVALTGVVVASFSGGLQYALVPLKLSAGLLFGALLCLPGLYVITCLSGGRTSFRSTVSALAMGLGVQALLLVAFAPVAWVFAQSTTSPGFMGALWVVALCASAAFGLAMTSNALRASGARVGRLWPWKLTFVVVMLQLATNLRPLVGPHEGFEVPEKRFFMSHWARTLAGTGEGRAEAWREGEGTAAAQHEETAPAALESADPASPALASAEPSPAPPAAARPITPAPAVQPVPAATRGE